MYSFLYFFPQIILSKITIANSTMVWISTHFTCLPYFLAILSSLFHLGNLRSSLSRSRCLAFSSGLISTRASSIAGKPSKTSIRNLLTSPPPSLSDTVPTNQNIQFSHTSRFQSCNLFCFSLKQKNLYHHNYSGKGALFYSRFCV